MGDLFSVQQNVVEGMHSLGFLHTETAGCVSLRIAVDGEHFHFTRC